MDTARCFRIIKSHYCANRACFCVQEVKMWDKIWYLLYEEFVASMKHFPLSATRIKQALLSERQNVTSLKISETLEKRIESSRMRPSTLKVFALFKIMASL